MQRSSTRREARKISGRFRGGKLAPALAVPFLGGEGGMLSQRATLELDPVAGRIRSPITAYMVSVFVPVQAMDAERDRDNDLAGITEVIRQKLLTGNPLFGLEPETEMSKRLGVNPVPINGQLMVSEGVRFAYNAAINYLRRRKYVYAELVPPTNTAVTPALLSTTILERFNAALDPDDHINGAVQLDFPEVKLPVKGITQTSNYLGGGGMNSGATVDAVHHGSSGKDIQFKRKPGNPAGTELDIYAELNAATAGSVSLSDFYNAQKMDSLTRQMRKIADENPIDGEEMVLRWAHNLSVDPGRHPFVIAEEELFFNPQYDEATDGAGLMDEVALSKLAVPIDFAVPVPRTELGGIVITFMSVKPDETIAAQPHPILAAPWGLINEVAEEMKLDPVPVLMREVNGEVPVGNEAAVAFYTGHNELKKSYVNYGFNRHVDPATVESKTAIWQLDIPVSVTPQNIVYPADISHYPFLDQNAEICTYSLESHAVVRTSMFFGPSPVETVDVIDSADLFDEV